jgi:O-methyltransferase
MRLTFLRNIVCRALAVAGYRLIPVTTPLSAEFPPDFTPREIDIIRAVRPFTMTSPERLYGLIQAVYYLVQSNIPGAIVECGVWRGGSMMAIAQTLLELQHASRELYLFDTFEGMLPPQAIDRNYRGEPAEHLMAVEARKTSRVWAVASLEEVQQNLEQTGYTVQHVHYIQGKVEDTIPARAPEQIALLRLDTDWYESTQHELEQLFPRLVSGGVLIVDDYGHWEGARKAVDEYITRQRLHLLLCRMDYTGRIAIKQGA